MVNTFSLQDSTREYKGRPLAPMCITGKQGIFSKKRNGANGPFMLLLSRSMSHFLWIVAPVPLIERIRNACHRSTEHIWTVAANSQSLFIRRLCILRSPVPHPALAIAYAQSMDRCTIQKCDIIWITQHWKASPHYAFRKIPVCQ